MQIIPTVGTVWLVVKLFFIVGLSVYLIFALVVIRQVQIMTDTINLNFQAPIKILSFLHFLFALGILVLAVIYL